MEQGPSKKICLPLRYVCEQVPACQVCWQSSAAACPPSAPAPASSAARARTAMSEIGRKITSSMYKSNRMCVCMCDYNDGPR